MTAGGETSKYHYSGDKVIYVTNGSNNITAEYSYDSQGNPATMTYNNVTYYYHLDGHGNVTAMTDAAGNTVAEYSYDAWGKILSQSGSMATINPFRYAGYRYDEATALYYLMARYYDPGVGRFITRDTFHGFDSEPQSLNQYAYCHNNPVMYVDPSGNYAAVARTYDVPGIGNVILAATGILIIGSIVISTGSWLYNKAVNWIKSWGAAQLAQAIKNIPNKLKKSNDVVDLSKFNNKKPGGGPPTWIGPLGYMIQKDMAGHGGRAYKLLDWAGKRIASLASNGKILGK